MTVEFRFFTHLDARKFLTEIRAKKKNCKFAPDGMGVLLTTDLMTENKRMLGVK